MKDTKHKILETAIMLYNRRGVGNVTLRDIADAVGISAGNLAYHFKNQDFIIEAAFREMVREREEILAGVQQIPSFENINRQLLPMLQIARQYQFIYLDTVHVIRTYPQIAALHQEYIDNSIRYIRAVIDYSVGAGNMQPEQLPGQFQRLAQTVWMIISYWLQQMTIMGNKTLQIDEVRKSIWDLVLPHLTDKGRRHFQGVYPGFATTRPPRKE